MNASLMTLILVVVAFAFVALAAQRVGKFASFAKLPLITGYLMAGVIVGPFVLGWLSKEAIHSLRVIDHVSLAFIAFAAGSELCLKEVRSRLKSIATTTAGIVLSTFALGTVAVLIIANHIPFMREMAFSTRLAVALMAAAILVARSPSSAIAIINELRARGPYTKTALGVTVVMDAVVIVLFACSMSIAHFVVGSSDFDPRFVLWVTIDLLASLSVGYLSGRLLTIITRLEIDRAIRVALVLLVGFGIFWVSGQLRGISRDYLNWPVAIEPLLACMIAGFVVTNQKGCREEFEATLHKVAPAIYVVFFTLVGASMALDSLIDLWPIALILFGVRLLGIVSGSVLGGLVSKSPSQHIRLGWMAFVTQAGIGLGLAKEAADEFPTFGDEFATMIIAIIVINQLVGPPLFKLAIKRVGESHLPAIGRPDEIRDALILGIDDQSLALARMLKANNWKVVMADTNPTHVESLTTVDIEEHHIETVDERTLTSLISHSTDAVVAMLGDDEANYTACELGYERFGVSRLIVRLNDLSWSDKFAQIGALVVEPASAMVNLLDQFVRLPQLATLLLHRDPEHEVIQITVADPDIEGLPLRELRLPLDVRVLGITRDGHAIVPHGHTIVRHNDEVTLVGELHHLEEIASRWGY